MVGGGTPLERSPPLRGEYVAGYKVPYESLNGVYKVKLSDV